MTSLTHNPTQLLTAPHTERSQAISAETLGFLH
jgi:hypothetical protein